MVYKGAAALESVCLPSLCSHPLPKALDAIFEHRKILLLQSGLTAWGESEFAKVTFYNPQITFSYI